MRFPTLCTDSLLTVVFCSRMLKKVWNAHTQLLPESPSLHSGTKLISPAIGGGRARRSTFCGGESIYLLVSVVCMCIRLE